MQYVLLKALIFKPKIEVIKEDQLINAAFGKAISEDGNLIINADKFIYQIKNKILNASGMDQ